MNNKITKYKVCSKMESAYKNSINAGDICIWEWDLDNNSIFFSDQWSHVFGEHLKKVSTLYEFIEEFAVETDKKSALNDLKYYLNGNCHNYNSEFRVRKEKGEYTWVLLKGKIKRQDLNQGKLYGIMTDISSIKTLEAEVRKLAYYNSLTELPNRNLFLYNFSLILEECKKSNKRGALVFIDIDNFKQVNDTYGHDYGDVLLKVFSQVIAIYSECYGEAYHLSGDEFIIIMDKFSSNEDIHYLCNSLMESCRNAFEIKDELIYISISIGVSIFPDQSTDVNELYKYVDLAMYYSKDHGKSQYTFFNNNINDVYSRRILIEKELKGAIAGNEFYVVYQPQIDTETDSVVGLEALLRWHNRTLGNVGPAEFIPIAERNGDITLIGEFVIKEVCRKIRSLIDEGLEFGTMAINVSPIQLKKINFMNFLMNSCDEYNVPYNLLTIEITEGTLIDLNHYDIEILNKIIDSGFKIAVDDFGSGYSSLKYLAVLPISTLKIDKSFTDNMDSRKNLAVIKCIIDLSRVLKYEVIAEGVESKEQIDILYRLGCSMFQGYYFSKPVNEDQVIKILDKYNP